MNLSESDLIELRTSEVRGKAVIFVSGNDKLINHIINIRKRPLSKKSRIRNKQLKKDLNDFLHKAVSWFISDYFS